MKRMTAIERAVAHGMTIVIDTREKEHVYWTFTKWGISTLQRKVDYGDYTILHHEKIVSIERKSEPDFIQTLFSYHQDSTGKKHSNYDRFTKELEQLARFEHPLIIAETDIYSLTGPSKSNNVHPNSMFGRVAKMLAEYRIPIMFACGHAQAETFAANYLAQVYNRIHGLGDHHDTE
jgi:ERCC4-type nuclease